MGDFPEKSWSLDGVRAREALALVGGPDDWGDIDVAHIDTGVTAHPSLGAWVQVARGRNFVEVGAAPIDPLSSDAMNAGHGTRTASVLTGLLGGTFAGAAPKVPVIPYRVSDSVVLAGKRQRANIAAAINDAVENRACEVISISLGFPLMSIFENVLGRAVDRAYERGVIICAAGGQVVNTICYPGKFFRAVAVGGYTGFPGRRGMYMNYGHDGGMNGFVDVWGPADPVWRADVQRAGTEPTYGYGWGDGTSFATPHAAAAAAMWLRHRERDIAERYTQPWMRVEAFRLLLKRTARDLTTEGFRDFEGMRPAGGDEIPPRKGDADGGGKYVGGGLDILALLRAPLPNPSDLREMPKAESQWG